ncbi:epimerase [bacterium SCSIO 12741]|nr:epimerase [bacterium SCSIO 12741]
MGLKVVITGASGMVGKGVLLECLDSPLIDQAITINRRSIEVDHPKHKELILKDFSQVSSIAGELSNCDAAYFCLGISAVGLSEEKYTEITHSLTLNFAQEFLIQNPDSVFCYVSGAGTDSSEKGRSMWARVKGKTENDLLAMNFSKAYMFRPGFIQPLRGIQSRTAAYRVIYKIFWPLYLVLKQFPAAATNTTNLGKAMIEVASKKPDLKILGNKEINREASKLA